MCVCVSLQVLCCPTGNMSMDGVHQRPWESEDIDQGLAADLDDSLSGLGVDISTVSKYIM